MRILPREIFSDDVAETGKADAEAIWAESVTEAVITVTCCFNDAQRQATKRRRQDCRPEVKRIINEPYSSSFGLWGLIMKRAEDHGL